MDESDQELQRNVKGEKKARRRKKRIYKSIREQMEFYFSDSNLQKDKFLINLLKESADGFVDLVIFTRFNKIRALTTDVWEIRNALSQSEFLEVSNDGKQVRRTTPVEEKQNTDDCTIYVERLPPYADHDWLKSLFSDYGVVTYISLPRYKQSGKLKGFAFVEFATPDAAKRACEHLGSYSKQQEPPENQDSTGNTDDLDESEKLKEQEIMSPKPSRGKRKLDESDIETLETKRCKAESETEENIENGTEMVQPEKDAPLKEIEMKTEELIEDNGQTIEIKRRRKHKKKPKNEDVDSFMLRIMSKAEWKRWKNKYLALQKSTMAQIKKMLYLEGCYQPQKNEESSIKEQSNNSNAKNNKQSHAVEFQSGVIICIHTPEPIRNCSEFKNKVRALGNVAYIDVSEGDNIAYIRCTDTDSAHHILRDQEPALGFMELLTGEDETSYWEKIRRDRDAKYCTKSRQKKRGHEKIMLKAEKIMGQNRHIRFDD